jgi:hypothetical protein
MEHDLRNGPLYPDSGRITACSEPTLWVNRVAVSYRRAAIDVRFATDSDRICA